MSVALPTARTIDHLDLKLRADGRHSLPTQLRITGDDGTRVVKLPSAPLVATSGVDSESVSFAPLHTRRLSVTITRAKPFVMRSNDGVHLLPAGVAELGIPGVSLAPAPAQLPGTCTSGLVTIDGHEVSVRVTGSTVDALQGRPVAVSACGSSEASEAAESVALGSGSHQVVSLRNRHGVTSSTPFDLSRVVLASAGGGSAAPAASIMTAPDRSVTAPVTVQHQTRTSMKLLVPASDSRRWLVLGESLNSGWHATIAGHDLGPPQLVDGYANGWLLPASTVGHAVTVSVVWTPQRYVWIALWLSLVGGIACLVILGWSLLTARRRVAAVAPVPSEDASITVRPPLLEPALTSDTRLSVGAVVVLAVLAGVVVHPWVGLLVGALTYASIRDRRARLVVRYAPVAIVAFIALYMAGAQAIEHYATGTHWPSIFSWARVPMWIALFLLLVDATVEWLWRRTSPP
jgi:arabinofuranan 3-O-arabinosyltransferase